VARKDVDSVLDIYDIGRKENADVVVYGTLTKVDVYYGSSSSSTRGYNYPIKTVEVELQFIETETRRRIWKGTGSLEDRGYMADEFLINKLLAEMVDKILPQWKEQTRSKSDAAMLKIGDKAPLFEVSDVNGDLYALKDDVGEKVIVLNFWSLFCEQCKVKMRLMDDVNRRYSKKGVKIISVSLEGEPLADRIKSYVDDSGYDLTFLLDEYSNGVSEVADPYKVPGTPSLYVIGKSGEIVFVRSGHVTTDELSAVIEAQL
jgi:peroxiredoxin